MIDTHRYRTNQNLLLLRSSFVPFIFRYNDDDPFQRILFYPAFTPRCQTEVDRRSPRRSLQAPIPPETFSTSHSTLDVRPSFCKFLSSDEVKNQTNKQSEEASNQIEVQRPRPVSTCDCGSTLRTSLLSLRRSWTSSVQSGSVVNFEVQRVVKEGT